MTSSTWSCNFISKRFLVRTLYIRHVIKVQMPSIVCFYQRQALVQVSTPFHMRKLRFHGCVRTPFKPCMYTGLKVRRVKSWFKFSKISKERLKIWFLGAIFHKWIPSKNNLILRTFFLLKFSVFYFLTSIDIVSNKEKLFLFT